MIDTTIQSWAAGNGLHVQTDYRDEEVRSIEVVDDSGTRYQIWLVQLAGGALEVNAWDYRAPAASFPTNLATLPQALDAAYQQVLAWILAAGHTRTQ